MQPKFWEIVYQPGRLLQKIGWCLLAYLQRLMLLPSVASYDVVYVHLWATPFGPPVYERLLRRLARRIVYDIDDLVYFDNVKGRRAHRFVGALKGHRKPLLLMQLADHVITCTPYLDEFVHKYNPVTTDISSTVDLNRYVVSVDYRKAGPLTIGWSGSLSTARNFHLLAPVFRRLRKKYDFRILVMGDADLSIPGLEIEARSWKEEHEMATLHEFDIGVYPLPDETWVLGKSGLKAIQYMALGIPTVATAIGANFRVIEDGVSGFLVKTESEWYERLAYLLESADSRETIGRAGRLRVEEKFSVQANQATYAAVLNSLL